jgi:hypothetical protein
LLIVAGLGSADGASAKLLPLGGAPTFINGFKCRPILDLISSVIPQAAVLNAGKELITGTGAFVGTVRIEAYFTDGASGHSRSVAC